MREHLVREICLCEEPVLSQLILLGPLTSRLVFIRKRTLKVNNFHTKNLTTAMLHPPKANRTNSNDDTSNRQMCLQSEGAVRDFPDDDPSATNDTSSCTTSENVLFAASNNQLDSLCVSHLAAKSFRNPSKEVGGAEKLWRHPVAR